jgi:hypothetical protein
MSSNQGAMSCPHCGNTNTWPLLKLGDAEGYNCPTCKPFYISNTKLSDIENGDFDPRDGHFEMGPDGQKMLVP